VIIDGIEDEIDVKQIYKQQYKKYNPDYKHINLLSTTTVFEDAGHFGGKEDEIKHQISVIDAVQGGCVGGFAQESNFINCHKKYQDRGIEQRLVDDCPKPRTLVLRESVFEDFFVYIFQEVNHFALSDAG